MKYTTFFFEMHVTNQWSFTWLSDPFEGISAETRDIWFHLRQLAERLFPAECVNGNAALRLRHQFSKRLWRPSYACHTPDPTERVDDKINSCWRHYYKCLKTYVSNKQIHIRVS